LFLGFEGKLYILFKNSLCCTILDIGINDESLHSGSETWDFANKVTKSSSPNVDNFFKFIKKILKFRLINTYNEYQSYTYSVNNQTIYYFFVPSFRVI